MTYCQIPPALLVIGAVAAAALAIRLMSVEQWGIYELTLNGPKEGNPFTEVTLAATFAQDSRTIQAKGFYDGEGAYKVRFMPDRPGRWAYRTAGNRRELDGLSGQFDCTPASAGNHGPVGVVGTYHFAHADGAPYRPIGTTCYCWAHSQPAQRERTLATLRASPFNKVRMCVLPKKGYRPAADDPSAYPFQGGPHNWDFTRPVPSYFRQLEKRIGELRELGIEADLILYHPYDHEALGLEEGMDAAADSLYVSYVVARFAAYRNVWWSLANEYDFITVKTQADWDRLFRLVQAEDPYGHLRSIHNARELYSYWQPWVTHASIQNGSAVGDFGRAVLLRDAYRKPVIYDEVKYEGDLPRRWGNLSAEELVHRFWQGIIAGTYVTHGEVLGPPKIRPAWTAGGGELRGQSPPRLAFLRQVLDAAPAAVEPIDKWQDLRTAGEPGEYYLVYFGHQSPGGWSFELPYQGLAEGMTFRAEVLDTWNMTVEPVDGTFTAKPLNAYRFKDAADRKIPLPARPYMALRITRIGGPAPSAPVVFRD